MRFLPQIANRAIRSIVWTVVSASAFPVLAGEVRTWSDASGKFRIKGELVEQNDESVTLLKPDGKKLKIAISKLSQADQDYLKSQVENPFEEVADDDSSKKPMKKTDASKESSSEESAPSDSGKSGSKTSLLDFAKSEANTINSEPVLIDASGEEWKLDIAPSTAEPLLKGAMKIPPKKDFFDGIKGLAIASEAGIGWVTVAAGRPGGEAATTLIAADLKGGKKTNSIELPGAFLLWDVSPDGKYVVIGEQNFGFGQNEELWICEPKGSDINPRKRFAPYSAVTWDPHKDVAWAKFLPDNRLVTLNGAGTLYIWELKEPSASISVEIGQGGRPALSPDSKYLAFQNDAQLAILNLETGKIESATTATKTPNPQLAFSPNGKRLAILGQDRLLIHDATNGQQVMEMMLVNVNTGWNHASPFGWTSDQHVWIAGTLIDVENQAQLWTYNGADALQFANGAPIFVVAPHGQPFGVLLAPKIPHPAALSQLKAAMAQPDFLVLKPGSSVAIDVNGIPDPAQQKFVVGAIRKLLSDNGNKVSQTADLRLIASMQPGESQEVGYHVFGRGQMVYQMQVFNTKLEFQYQGKSVWQTHGSNVPGFIQLKEDQTLSDYLKQRERPDYSFFERVVLPKVLQKPTANSNGLQTLGASSITVGGIK